jgi:hypothetical protein
MDTKKHVLYGIELGAQIVFTIVSSILNTIKKGKGRLMNFSSQFNLDPEI